MVLIAKIEVIEVRIIRGCKNDANPPACLDMWVLEVGSEQTKRWKIGTNHRLLH